MSVDYISFSAHTDYQQTSEFIRLLKPAHVILVHGEQNEMFRLKSALQREYESDKNANITFHNPRNTHTVSLYFRGEKTAKVMGSLAIKQPENGDVLSGVLVKRDFKYHILAASDLSSMYQVFFLNIFKSFVLFIKQLFPINQNFHRIYRHEHVRCNPTPKYKLFRVINSLENAT